ncbi:MAG: SDR family oxidoreductase [Planctomycetaceae bacterium]|jgi:3-oxoacyl-[acyl-carrier protein] reductase|nr:SDR family oxidoreductase [Planctomycetaceae bacterium]
MDLHLKNKTVLVTGGSSGLGKSISSILAQEGANVALNYVANPNAQAVAEELQKMYGVKTLAVYADVSKEDEVQKMFGEIESQLGPVDAVVNNAAIVANPQCEDLTLDEFQRCVAINLQGTFLVSREAVRHLKMRIKKGGAPGSIVNISSQAALRGSQSGKTAYDMTKAGILGFTRSLALEVAADGIRVNAVLPGIMHTKIIAKFIEADPEKFNKRSPLGRIAQTDEIAKVTVFLVSDCSSYMTGATVDVSGGMAMH